MYLHLPEIEAKCRYICHTWILWSMGIKRHIHHSTCTHLLGGSSQDTWLGSPPFKAAMKLGHLEWFTPGLGKLPNHSYHPLTIPGMLLRNGPTISFTTSSASSTCVPSPRKVTRLRFRWKRSKTSTSVSRDLFLRMDFALKIQGFSRSP